MVTAAVYASFGHQVIGLDVDEAKIKKLRASQVPFYEPGLQALLSEQQAQGLLTFTTSYDDAIPQAEVVMIAVGTPSAPDGGADLKFVIAACEEVAKKMGPGTIVAIKSTVPPGTLDIVKTKMDAQTNTLYHLASLPEFLREGTAVQDTLHPDRVVIGATETKVFEKLVELHAPLDAPVLKVSPSSAQMAKYAANAYLATRITYINQIADLCAKNGADIQQVIAAIGLDERIGDHYWYPGFGYGGSCFPKDVKELAFYSRTVGEADNLLVKVDQLNHHRPERLLEQYGLKIGDWSGKKVAVLGLAFKPNTDDMREAPSTKVIPYLLAQGASVTAYDPKAGAVAKNTLKPDAKLEIAQNLNQALQNVDVIMVLIEWPEFLTHDFSTNRTPDTDQWFLDARNQFDPARVRSWGYHYLSVGRP